MARSSATTTEKEDNFFVLFGLDATEILKRGYLDDAEIAVVNRVYRRKALLCHPDKDPSPGARQTFERLKAAAEALTDPERSRVYLAEFQREADAIRASAKATADAERFSTLLRQRQAQHRAAQEAMDAANEELRSRHGAAEASPEMREMALEELRRALMSSWEEIELSMLREWEVGEDELAAKEREVELGLRLNSAHAQSRRARDAALASAKRLHEALSVTLSRPSPAQPRPEERE